MDGTRDKPHRNTRKNSHVKRTYDLLNTDVKSFYIEGVGAGNRVQDGIKAFTTKDRVMRAYRFLIENYQPGDSIFLFGFSRGANQCRILSSIIYTIGIIDMSSIKSEDQKQKLLHTLYDLYVLTPASAKKNSLATYLNNWQSHYPNQHIMFDTSGTTMIEAMGLWDTVEALAVNDEFEISTPLPQHLNQLCNVKKVFHAVSLDDNRSFNYTPILVTHRDVELRPNQNIDSTVEEVWFNGSHKDVGGGVKSKKRDQLSGISINWMLSKLKPYQIVRDTTYTENIYGQSNDMRRRWYLRTTSPGDTLRGINKYWAQMNPAWNQHRIKVHQSVVLRLDSGIIQTFKLKYRNNKKRKDWYDWESFNECFKRDTIDNKIRIRFRTDKPCKCIEVVYDSPSVKQEQPLQVKNGYR
jgi:uncharacterized protein (DUF2235 family)